MHRGRNVRAVDGNLDRIAAIHEIAADHALRRQAKDPCDVAAGEDVGVQRGFIIFAGREDDIEGQAVDAGLGAQLGFGALAGEASGPVLALPGLLGSEEALAAVGEAHHDRARLVVAAVALGVARAAIAHAVAAMKAMGVRPGPDEKAPHWVIADSATEVEAARMVTYRAAQALDHNESDAAVLVVRAKAFAANAAEHAADAAIRMEGPGGYVRGGVLERLTRDARTLAVILEG